jgi:hypothetical protein
MAKKMRLLKKIRIKGNLGMKDKLYEPEEEKFLKKLKI